MPDVSVTVNNVPIQVTSCISNVIDVSVATAGSQGATGPIGPTGATGPAGSNGSIGITGISVTGYYSQTGLINFTGAGSTVVLTGLNNTIIFSGTADTSNFSTTSQFNALSGNIYTTGQTLDGRTNALSGYISNFFVNRTSNQSITGQKTFVSTVFADSLSGANSTVGLDLINGLINIGGSTSVDYNSKQLNNNNGNPTVRWNNYILNDSSQNTAIDWNNRLLKTDVVTTTIDWSGKIISGTWNAQAIRVSGASLITGVDTGSFASIVNLLSTGQTLDNKINNWGIRQLNNLSGQLTISGAGNLTAQNSGTSTIFISGDVSNLATISNLQTTGSTLNSKINTLSGYSDNTFALLSSPRIFIGSGSPEGSIQAVSGSLYTDWYNQTFYMKISGNSSNAYGWV